MSMEIWIDNDLITSAHRGIRLNLRENTDAVCRFICTDVNLYIYIKKIMAWACIPLNSGVETTCSQTQKKAAFHNRKRPRGPASSPYQAAVWLA